MKKLEREYDTASTVVFKLSAIAGNPGKYMSMENGPMADNKPRRIIKNVRCLLVIKSYVAASIVVG